MNKMICRLCLQTISDNNYCQPVQEPLLKSLNLNINISKENFMCIDCASCLQVVSNFTPSSVYLGGGTLPLSDPEIGVKLYIEPIETIKPLMKTEIKCSFCTKTYGREDLLLLMESKDNKFLVNLLEQYISKMNLKMAKELLTCDTCLVALEGVSNVILKCLEVEKKINKYIEVEGTDDKGQVDLEKVQQFMFKPTLKLEIESFGENRSDQVQVEYNMMTEAEVKYKKEISITELVIKTEVDDITSEQSICDISKIKSEQIDCDGLQELFIENKSASKIEMFKCELCSFEATQKFTLERHLFTHKSPSELKMFKCEFCPYEAKRKGQLKAHLLTHRNPSEIKMFKCELCPYEAKQKYPLIRHLFTHKSPSELKMFKCEFCPYEGKQKRFLKEHLSTHKSPLGLKMFKCEMCPYEAKRKSNLNRHLLTHTNLPKVIHKNSSGIKMFKCEFCSYEAKQKAHLETHLVIHKDPSEIKMFQCGLCSYETKRKSSIKTHLLTIHRNSSEIKMFTCELCSYETKYKSHLNRHLLTTHRNPSEVMMFKCGLCSYDTIHKCHLKRHILTHKSPSKTNKLL